MRSWSSCGRSAGDREQVRNLTVLVFAIGLVGLYIGVLDRVFVEQPASSARRQRRLSVMTDLTTTTETKAPEKRWYIIHAYSGYENKVKTNLEHRIESMGMEDKIFQVLVPMEDEIEIRQGQRHTVQKVYPGYVLVEMILDPDGWFVVRNTPGVTSFVGGANIPGVRSELIPSPGPRSSRSCGTWASRRRSTAWRSPRVATSGSPTGRSPSSSARSRRSTSATRSRSW